MAQGKKAENVSGKRVMSPEFRVSFPHVYEPQETKYGDRYKVAMLFTKDTDLSELKAAMMEVIKEVYGPDKKKWPKSITSPFKNGDQIAEKYPKLAGYEGHIVLEPWSKNPPEIIDQSKRAIGVDRKREFYPGCYARATISFGINTEWHKLSVYLGNIQKLRDGDKLGGGRAAKDEFEVVDDGSDDASNYDDFGDSESTEVENQEW